MPKRSCSSLFTLFYPNLLDDVQPRERDETLYNVHISSRLRCNWSRSSSSRRRRRRRRRRRAAEAGAARMVTKITLKHHGG